MESAEKNPCNKTANEAVREKVIKSVIFVLLAVILARLVLYYCISDTEAIDFGIDNQTEINRTTDVNEIEQNAVMVKRNIIRQPSCPRSYLLVILDEICTDLVIKYELCTPADFDDKSKHRDPSIPRKKQAKNDRKGKYLLSRYLCFCSLNFISPI